MQSASAMLYSSSPEDAIRRLRSGETQVREVLIQDNWKYISATVSKMIGKPAESTDEFSIALQAFNEAIDHYDEAKNSNFLPFANLVINRRVIDYIRKASKYNNEYPFTYFDTDDNEDSIEKIALNQPNVFTEKIEIEEEIMKFRSDLASFGITMEDLVKLSPKHKDTKIMCISIARKLAEDKTLSTKLSSEKRLPITEITNFFIVKRKTLETHRKYIIALFLILNSNMEVIKGYSTFLMKGVN